MSLREIGELPEFLGQGLIGLGKKGKDDQQSTFVEGLNTQGVIKLPIFSLYFSSDCCSYDSLLTIGDYRRDLYTGDMQFVQSLNEEFWDIDYRQLLLTNDRNENKFIEVDNPTKLLLIDSGTTKLGFPS